MALTFEQITAYHARLSTHDDALLHRLEAEARRDRFPIIGPAAGKFLYLMARAIAARKVFELGSGYGYSTLWFARAVRENVAAQGAGRGEVHHTVWDENLHRRAKKNIKEAGYEDLVRFHLGEAVQTLRETDGMFDLIFNDIEKDGYPDSLPVMKSKLRVGGLVPGARRCHRGVAGGIKGRETSFECKRPVKTHTRPLFSWRSDSRDKRSAMHAKMTGRRCRGQ